MARKVLISLFLIFGIYYVFFINSIDPSVVMLFKLIPMLLLITLAFMTKLPTKLPYHWLISIGLIFCAIGDYTLQWFIVGLCFFLIGHIFYIFAFRTTNNAKPPLFVQILLGAYGLFMVVWIAGSVFKGGETILAIAVVAYMMVIFLMGLTSFRTGSPFAITGALLFIASDSVLAINKFMFDVAYSHQLIMFTYYGAQFFFMLSIVQYFNIRNKVVQ
ncbi:lysoplasmalogenase [Solibacillus sp. FSL K6-1523]|uniref:lysoplasmalogenase n=1 Tax=Solibacillus sp. FSL K6-1523 TaxID=2921471 RepID=UPI0030F52DF4